MNRDDQEDTTIYSVVINEEEHYSIWPADREPPQVGGGLGRMAPKLSALSISKRSGPICAH
jgi:MbtH protein